MTKDDVIRMAREAGWTGPEDNAVYFSMLKRLIELARAAEREECAKVAKENAAEYKVGGSLYPMLGMHNSNYAATASDHIAHLISERGRT
jgi:hypothetical protein